MEAASASQDISELLRTSVVDAGADKGGGAGVRTCLDTDNEVTSRSTAATPPVGEATVGLGRVKRGIEKITTVRGN